MNRRDPAWAWREALDRIAAERIERSGRLSLLGLAIPRLPAEIATLDWLDTVDCSNTQVSDLTPLAALTGLTSLDCSSTPVSDLAPLATLRALASLHCGFTDVTDLTPLAALSALTRLTCAFTSISDLAPLAGLTALTFLNCGVTRVSDLAPLAKLTALTSLDCGTTRVSDLAAMAKLTALTSLDCSSTEVSDLTPLAKLTALTSLDCGDTRVSDLTPLAKLTALTSLDCSGTEVSDLASLAALPALNSLDCSFAEVSSLAPLAKLAALTDLNCSFTAVSSLAPLAKLAALTGLNCSGTKVVDLAPLATLSALTRLNCNGLHLAGEHEPLWRLPNLKLVNLVDSTLGQVPEALLGYDCLEQLRDYFATRGDDAVPVRAARLFLLGNGAVGKTQIGRRLRGLQYDEHQTTTHGIDVHHLTLPVDGDRPLTLSLWDFGGQPLYHGTHALFLGGQALFLIAWAPDHEAGDHVDSHGLRHANLPLPYWIDMARQAAGDDCALILTETRVDTPGTARLAPPVADADLDWCRDRTVHNVSARHGHGFGALRDIIAAAAERLLARRGLRLIAPQWLAVITAIAALRPDSAAVRAGALPAGTQRTMAHADFIALCQRHGVTRGIDTLLCYLDATGEVIWRKSLFQGAVIIDQNWALDAIYTLFERQACLNRLRQQQGRFRAAELGAWLWDAAGFSPEEQRLFLSYMVECGLCFAHYRHDDETIYLAPAGLPGFDALQLAQVRAWQDGWPQPEPLTYDCTLLHVGLVQRAIAALGSQLRLDADYWDGGVMVFDPASRCRLRLRRECDSGWRGRIVLEAQHPPGTMATAAEALLTAAEPLVTEALGRHGRLRAPLARHAMADAPSLGELVGTAPLPPAPEPGPRQAARQAHIALIDAIEAGFRRLRPVLIETLCIRLDMPRHRRPPDTLTGESRARVILAWADEEATLADLRDQLQRLLAEGAGAL